MSPRAFHFERQPRTHDKYLVTEGVIRRLREQETKVATKGLQAICGQAMLAWAFLSLLICFILSSVAIVVYLILTKDIIVVENKHLLVIHVKEES